MNDVFEKLEKFYEGEMKILYKKHGLKKSGDGPGGKFNGPKIKFLIKENLLELEEILPTEEKVFVTYLKNFEQNFYSLYQIFNLNIST